MQLLRLNSRWLGSPSKILILSHLKILNGSLPAQKYPTEKPQFAMHHPTQRLHFCPTTNTLYTGTGGTLKSFSASTGSLLATWSAPELRPPPSTKADAVDEQSISKPPEPEAQDVKNEGNVQASPTKKRKVEKIAASPAREKEKEGQQRKSQLGARLPTARCGSEKGANSITRVITAAKGKYVVVVTNEDKTVRVFEVASDGGLTLLSERAMPKRPCAVSLTDYSRAILIADKFGDVYSIPLLPFSPAPAPETAASPPVETQKLSKEERERKAVEKRQRTNITVDLPFENTLILGHVSMLVDILAVTIPASEGTKERCYVLTADRDEHIRVSRYPLGYVIEGYCLGHRCFVSKLLVPSWDQGQLISGGGDEFLILWDWRNGKTLERIDLSRITEEVVGRKVTGGNIVEGGEGEFKLAVGGMWELPAIKGVFVAVEKIKAIFFFTLSENSLVHTTTITLSGSPLDLAVDPAANSFYVTLDTTEDAPSMEKYALEDGNWVKKKLPQAMLEELGKIEYAGDVRALKESLLYPMGMLRKGFERSDKGE